MLASWRLLAFPAAAALTMSSIMRCIKLARGPAEAAAAQQRQPSIHPGMLLLGVLNTLQLISLACYSADGARQKACHKWVTLGRPLSIATPGCLLTSRSLLPSGVGGVVITVLPSPPSLPCTASLAVLQEASQ